MINYKIDHNNLTNPASHYMKNYILSLTSSMIKSFTLKFRNIEYNTDTGYLFEEIQTEKFSIIESPTEQYSLIKGNKYEPKGKFAEILLYCSDTKTVYMRTYPKLQDLIAKVGGVVKSVLIITNLVEGYFVDSKYMLKLINELISKSYKTNINNEGGCKIKVESDKRVDMDNSKSMNMDNSKNMCMNNNNNMFMYNKNNSSTSQIKLSWEVSKNQPDYKSPDVSPVNLTNNIYKNTCNNTNIHKKPIINGEYIAKNNRNKTLKEIQTSESCIKNKLRFTCMDYFRVGVRIRKNKKIDDFKMLEKYMNRKISIDHILKKLLDIDKLKFLLLKDVECHAFKLISSPNIETIRGYDYDILMGKDDVQSLWRVNEFERDLTKEELGELDKLIARDDLSFTEKRLFELIYD